MSADKELIDQLLVKTEFSDLLANLVYGFLELVGEAYVKNI